MPQNVNGVAGVIVRPLRAADVEACTALMAGLPLWQRYGVSSGAARDWFAGTLRGERLAQVAENAGRVLGFAVYLLRGTFGHSGYVWAVGVAPEAQHRGVGGRLMDAVEDEIFEAGPNVFLLVSARNTPAQRFYERRGYRRIGEMNDYVAPGLTEILYRKTRGPIRPDER
ncbi:MAG TPA: N-acetyltransferase [bacterium]|nr:N-acetyltransferase [bacterium]